jgi:plasmid stabilization system protein ParE
MKVVIAEEARRDLREIGDYIARDNPIRARSFVAELLGKARDLSDMPLRYPLIARYADRGIRRRPHARYAIFYRIDGGTVTVIHILHSARDYEGLLFPED